MARCLSPMTARIPSGGAATRAATRKKKPASSTLPAIPHKARPTKIFLIGLLSFLAVLILAAFQFGDNNGLNSMPYAQVRRLVSELLKAKKKARDGEFDLFARQPMRGETLYLPRGPPGGNFFLRT